MEAVSHPPDGNKAIPVRAEGGRPPRKQGTPQINQFPDCFLEVNTRSAHSQVELVHVINGEQMSAVRGPWQLPYGQSGDGGGNCIWKK